jgi:uncharacterized damage-inducible protein DinB
MTGANLLPDFDLEMANTRRTLERIPDEHAAFKPHEKSFALLHLAQHLSNIPSWTEAILTKDGLDMTELSDREAPTDVAGVLAEFDENVVTARAILEAATADDLGSPWTLKHDGAEMFTLRKGSVFRRWVMSHSVHHRAQLAVYLRLLDIPVPALYGPSADEVE